MKARLVVVCVLSLVAVLLLASPAPAGNSAGLKAGAARIDITPDKPVNMSGYAGRKDLSTGVHDPLSARAVAFEAGGKRLVLISTDIIGFYEEVRPSTCVRRFRTSATCSLRSCSSAASTRTRLPRPTLNHERDHPNNVEYTEALKRKLIEVARKALANMEPVKLGVGVGSCPVGAKSPGAARHRQRRELHRAGPQPLRDDGQGSPRDEGRQGGRGAAGRDVRLRDARDLARHRQPHDQRRRAGPGRAVRREDPRLRDVIAPIFVGASGNIDPWFRVLPKINEEPGWIPEPVLLGTFLGEEVVTRLPGDQRQTNPGRQDRDEFRDAATAGQAAGSRLDGEEARQRPPERHRGPDRRHCLCRPRRRGVARRSAWRSRRARPAQHTFVITHCNGAAGYLPTKEAYVQDGYEVNTSPFAPQAADIVIREVDPPAAGPVTQADRGVVSS